MTAQATPSAPRYRLGFAPAVAVGQEVRDCELEVLAHWYGDTSELLDDAYGAFEEQSAFLSVRRDDGTVVGVARVIGPGPRELKTLCDIAGPPWNVDVARAVAAAGVDSARCWDVATVAVRPELGAGGRAVASALYHGIIRGAELNGCPWLVAIIDRRARALLSMIGLRLHSLPGTRPAEYMGSSACAPVYCHIPEMVAWQRRTNPEAHRLVTLGLGLVDVALPSDAALRVPLVSGLGESGDGSSSVPIDGVDLREPRVRLTGR